MNKYLSAFLNGVLAAAGVVVVIALSLAFWIICLHDRLEYYANRYVYFDQASSRLHPLVV